MYQMSHFMRKPVYVSQAGFISWAGRFESQLVANPEDRFSCDVAQIYVCKPYNN